MLTLIVGGLGAPIPEEAPLLAAGYHAWRGDVPMALMGFAGIAGILMSDGLCFLLGRRLGRLTSEFAQRHTQWIRRSYRRRGAALVLVARLVPLGRGLIVTAAGLSEMRARVFFAWDLVGAVIATTAWLSLGAHLGPRFETFAARIRQAELLLLLVMIPYVALRFFVLWRRRKRAERKPPEQKARREVENVPDLSDARSTDASERRGAGG
jgi:membrane protein DedA with SNARE-associated domain